MNTHFFALGWRALWRDWRAGELRLLLLAVTLAVAALTAVGFFADRLQAGLRRDAAQMLGGDAVVVSDQATPASFIDQANRLKLQTAMTLSFPTMARAAAVDGGASKLVALKVVGPGYPLRGKLQTRSATESDTGSASQSLPPPGQAWAESALLSALNLHLGQTLLLGDSQFTVTREIITEPDRGTGFMSFSPRVMINQVDLAATALVQPASRISWRFAVAGRPAQVQQYQQWVQTELVQTTHRGLNLETLKSGRPEMTQTLERAEKFLNLVALLAALLCAVAVALAARAFAARHLDACAMLRVLGLSQGRIAGSYAVEFFLIGCLASAIGVALGFAVHEVFVRLLAGLVSADLPAASWQPALLGLGLGLTLLFAFGLPPVLQLAKVPPLRVMRRDVGALQPTSLAVLALGGLGFAALLLVMSRDWQLGLMTVGGFAAAAALFAALGALAVRALRRAVNDTTAPRWLVLATRQLSARPVYAVVQISALAVGLLALMLLVLLRTDLISSWRQATPKDAPNRFVINILPEQAQAFQQTLQQAGLRQYDWFPLIRGRLVAVNGQPVRGADYADDKAKRLVEREFNLSFTDQLPAHNPLVAGQWTAGEAGTVSVEEGLAQTLGLHLGDQLDFDVGGTPSQARITSLRKVDWGSMRANFFVLYPVAQLADVPTTYMTAFHIDGQAQFDNLLTAQFPNITTVDMTSTLAQLQRVIDQVIGAVQFLFGFTLAAGLVVLFAAVTATRDDRAREYAIMRALGASARLLQQVQGAELAGVGLLAGLLASIAAAVGAEALAHYAFNFELHLSYWQPLLGALVGACLALAAGWWGLREVLRRPVVQTLRRAAE